MTIPTTTKGKAHPPRYRWSHPREWFDWYLESNQHDRAALIGIARALADRLDGDQIQDEFQADMIEDLYFLDLANLTCPDCGDGLTDRTTTTLDDGTAVPNYCDACDREIDLGEFA